MKFYAKKRSKIVLISKKTPQKEVFGAPARFVADWSHINAYKIFDQNMHKKFIIFCVHFIRNF
jgi:hypothetical protein